VLLRIPVRTNNDDRYFTDPWQAIPSHGYTRIFDNMFAKHKDKITVRTGVDFFAPGVKESLPKRKLLIFTGPIDAYYASLGMPKLEYRSLRFEEEYHEPEGGYYQEALQVCLWCQHAPRARFAHHSRSPLLSHALLR
jgi:UDP-galactopyranose mutase